MRERGGEPGGWGTADDGGGGGKGVDKEVEEKGRRKVGGDGGNEGEVEAEKSRTGFGGEKGWGRREGGG